MRRKEGKHRRIKSVSGERAPHSEQRVSQIDQQLAVILEATTDGYWDWNVSTGVVHCQGWLGSLGYSAADLSSDVSLWNTIIHPDDFPAFESHLQAHFRCDTPALDFECRLRAKSGQYKWFRTRGKVVRRDADGHPVLVVGTILDIQECKAATDGEPRFISVFTDMTDLKRAREALQESEERLRLALAASQMFAFEWDLKTDRVHRSEEHYQILELPKDATCRTQAQYLESMHAEDRTHFLAVIKSLNPGMPSYRLTYAVLRPDVATVWLEESGRAFFDTSGTLLRVVGVVADITESRESQRALSELGGRLITSQEEERRRVARELHDNIGQELALLTLQAQGLDPGVPGEAQTTHSDMHELYKRIKAIALKVSKLSHRLHSSELDFLGLGVAAERLCRDFAKQYGIDLDYQIRSVPRKLDVGVSLCFYRILQEALQNVANHSKATRAAVQLSGGENKLTLRIDDNGIGFNVAPARYKAGLGLVSMRERMNLIGGQIVVTSELGKGTNVKATVAVDTVTACKADIHRTDALASNTFHAVTREDDLDRQPCAVS